MRIETAHIKSNVIYTAILIHTVIIAMAPALSLLGIIYIESKTHRRSKIGDSVMFDNSGLISGMVGFSIILIVVISFLIYFRNAKKKFIVAAEFDDQLKLVNLQYKTYYNNRIRNMEVKYQELVYSYDNQQTTSMLTGSGVSTNDLTVDRKIRIMNGKTYAGEISMGGTFWNKEGGKIKMILQKIDQIQQLQKS